MQTLVQTAGFALAVVGASVPLGTLLAVLLARCDLPGRRWFAGLLVVQLFLPLYLQAGAWQAGFGALGAFSWIDQAAPWLDGWRGAAWVHSLASVPWVALIVGLGLRFTPPEAEELGLTEGPPAWVVWRITLPQARPAIVSAAVWVALLTAGEMAVTDLFAVDTYAREVYTHLSLGATPGEAFATSVPYCFLAVGMIVVAIGICHRALGAPAPPAIRPRPVFELGRWRWLAWAAVLATTVVMLGVPLAGLIAKAGVVVESIDGNFVRRFEWARVAATCEKMVRVHRAEFGWTLLIGSLAALAAVAIAMPFAWRARHGGRRAWPALAISGVLAALPGPLLGLGIIALLNRRELPGLTTLYDHSILAPWLAQTLRALPIVMLVMWAAFRSVPRETLELAAMDGAGPVAQFWHVGLPMRRAAVAVAWLLGFVVAVGEISASILVLPPGVTTVAQRVFGLLHATAGDEVAGLGLVQAVFFAIIAAVVYWLARRVEAD
jgi:iron(III) transport system permease protein